jgi:hypothetical protein
MFCGVGGLAPWSRCCDAVAMQQRRRFRLVNVVVGGLVGAVVGAIVAVNVVIFSGVDRGYEASIPEVFRHNVFAGVITIAVLVAGPIAGIVVAIRARRNREEGNRPSE